MSKEIVLITTDLHPLIFEGLDALGYSYDYEPQISNAAVKQIIHKYSGLLISTSTIVDREMIDRADDLRFIGRAGSGLEIIDLEYARGKGIYCFNTPEGNRDAVAEHAIGLLLSLMHRIKVADAEVHAHAWNREKNRGDELMHKTVGLIGYGNTGTAMARKLSGFDVTILAYDKYRSGFNSEEVKESTLEELFDASDVLSVHVPLTAETDQWIDKDFIKKFRKDFYLLNCARGKIVNTSHLIEMLRSGKVKAAALDVLENEKIDQLSPHEESTFNDLLQFSNVILTPHIAGWTFESKEKIARFLLAKIPQP